jgi:hypothetical protein
MDSLASMPRRWRPVALAALVSVLIGPLTSAEAQEGWGAAPLAIPGSNATFTASVSVDGAGNLTVAWLEGSIQTEIALKVARYVKGTDRWTAPSTIATTPALSATGDPDLVVDAAGNAVIVWTAGYYRNNQVARALRYSAAADTWTPLDLPSTPFTPGHPVVAGNAAGDAVVLWTEETVASGGVLASVAGVLVRRFSSSTGTWSTPERLAISTTEPWRHNFAIDAAMDGAGNVHVVWSGIGETAVRTTRFDALTGTWGPIADLSAPLDASSLPRPRIESSDAGDVVSTWSDANSVFAARLTGTTWTAPVVVTGNAEDATTHPAISAAGHVTLVWTSGAPNTRELAAARYDPMTGLWSAPTVLAPPGANTEAVTIGADAPGNTVVVWGQTAASEETRLRGTRYTMGSATWDAPQYLSPAGERTLNGAVAVDAVGNAWLPRVTFAAVRSREILHWNAAPGAPVTGSIVPTRDTLTVSVTPAPTSEPPFAATNLEYSLDNGSTWIARTPASTVSPLTISGLTEGVVHALRVRAVNQAGPGTPTPALAVRAGVTTSVAPLRVVAIAGNAVTLAWSSTDGIVPTGYLLEGGLAPQQTLASVPTGSAANGVTMSLPPGIFFARIVSLAGGVRLSTSNEVRIVVGVPEAPSAAADLVGTANGSALALSWTNVLTGGAPTRLVIDVSGPVSGSILLPVSEAWSYAGVPPGRYTFRVTAINAVGASAPSAPVTVTFPGLCESPLRPPTDLVATATPGAAFVTWNPPAGGPAVTGYALHVSGAFTGVLDVTTRTLTTAAGPGSYTVSVRAITACGRGPATPPRTIVVP